MKGWRTDPPPETALGAEEEPLSRNRMTKEELRHDAFVENTARATAYVQQHFMTVLLAVAVLAVVVVGSIYIKQSRQRNQVQASQLLHRATSEYASGAYSQALLSLDDIQSRFAGTTEARAAQYFLGASHLALGENDPAIGYFKDYLDLAPKGLYANSAKMGLALAHESRGDLAEAAEGFRALRQAVDPADPLHAQAAFGEARVLQKLGQNDAAIAVLQTMLGSDDYTTRQKAENQIRVLQALAPSSAS
jgi:outer membrane protein assembly factor BamD (BamD/ComL family)